MLNNHQWGLRMRAIAQEPLQISFLDMNVTINHLRPQSYLPEADEINLTPNYCHHKSMANGKIEWYAEIYGKNISNGPIRMVMAAKKACWNKVGQVRIPVVFVFVRKYKIQNFHQITKFVEPTWGPPGFCRPQMGPMLVPLILISASLQARGANTTHHIYQAVSFMFWCGGSLLEYIYMYIYTLYIHSWQKRLLHPHWRQ